MKVKPDSWHKKELVHGDVSRAEHGRAGVAASKLGEEGESEMRKATRKIEGVLEESSRSSAGGKGSKERGESEGFFLTT